LHADFAVRTESLRKVYRSAGTELVVLDEVSLCVRRNERVAIIGESGAGKSTLLHLIGGLDRPSGGRILYGDRDIVGLSEQQLAEFRNAEIGFVWQNPSLLPEFSALENVMLPLLIRGTGRDAASPIAAEKLREVGLRERQHHRAGELSGGEQQRVALARALAAKPKVLLADEPTGSLDHRTGESIISLLTELHRAHDLTSVFVTHNLFFASRCDQVLELKQASLRTPPFPVVSEEAGVVRDATRLDGGNYV
jgi:lipoprotein-releasing system ATP-binding protein